MRCQHVMFNLQHFWCEAQWSKWPGNGNGCGLTAGLLGFGRSCLESTRATFWPPKLPGISCIPFSHLPGSIPGLWSLKRFLITSPIRSLKYQAFRVDPLPGEKKSSFHADECDAWAWLATFHDAPTGADVPAEFRKCVSEEAWW